MAPENLPHTSSPIATIYSDSKKRLIQFITGESGGWALWRSHGSSSRIPVMQEARPKPIALAYDVSAPVSSYSSQTHILMVQGWMITGGVICGNEQDARHPDFRNLIEQETGWVAD